MGTRTVISAADAPTVLNLSVINNIAHVADTCIMHQDVASPIVRMLLRLILYFMSRTLLLGLMMLLNLLRLILLTLLLCFMLLTPLLHLIL